MARELVISIWCDACMADGKTVDGEEFDLAVNGGGARTLALCPEHVGALLTPLARLLETAPTAGKAPTPSTAKPYGGAAMERARNESPWVCPHGDGYRVTGRAALGKHLKEIHASSIIKAREDFPQWAATLPTASGLRTSSPGYRERVCPGCGFSTMTGQGFSVHLRAHADMDDAERKRILDEERATHHGAHAVSA